MFNAERTHCGLLPIDEFSNLLPDARLRQAGAAGVALPALKVTRVFRFFNSNTHFSIGMSTFFVFGSPIRIANGVLDCQTLGAAARRREDV
ncbi:MAG TPA: hypothetical protein VGK17_14110 [Propionicimonas sp.]|jgi:hypothetical protein